MKNGCPVKQIGWIEKNWADLPGKWLASNWKSRIQVNDLDLVNIYIATYRNELTFNTVLDSYLNQTHVNIRIHIFDNSCADGFEEIKQLVELKKDKRIIYYQNSSQLGAHANYWQAINSIDFQSKAIFLSSDMGLAKNAIQLMLDNLRHSKAEIVMPATRNYLAENFSKDSLGFDQVNYVSLMPLFARPSLTTSIDVLERYFGTENISGDFYKFSFWGCLFDGALMRSPSRGGMRFFQHGFEQFFSMSLLIRANNVKFIPDEIIYNITGVERLGGTKRESGDLGRIECIMAAQMILEEYDFYLYGRKANIIKMRQAQIEKAIYFKKHFTGYDFYADSIIEMNRNYLS